MANCGASRIQSWTNVSDQSSNDKPEPQPLGGGLPQPACVATARTKAGIAVRMMGAVYILNAPPVDRGPTVL